jgi:PAS domain S-box-containing protein
VTQDRRHRLNSYKRRRGSPSSSITVKANGKDPSPADLHNRLLALKNLLENLEEGVISFDKRGRVTSWNKGAERIYGYQASEIIGKTLQRTIPKPALAEWNARMKRVFEDGKAVRSGPLERIRKDGKHIWIVATASPIKGHDGSVVGAAAMVSEVTAERELKEQLQQSERMYRELFETSRDIIFISGKDGKFIDINQAGVEAFGYKTKEEVLRLDIPKDVYLDPNDRKAFHEQVERNGYALSYELRLKKKNGEIMEVLETSTPIRDEEGKIVGFRGILRDVTEKKALEQKLKESEEKYRSLVDLSPDGVAVTRDGRFLYANEIFRSIYGYSKEDDLIHRPVSEIVGEEKKNEIVNWFLEQEFHIGVSDRYEFKGMRKNKESVDVEVRVRKIRFEGRDALLSIHRDISERKKLNEQLGEAEKIVGEIFATMADALVITDLNGKVLQVNREFEAMTGYGRSEVFGLTFPYPWVYEEEMGRFVLWISELREKNYLRDFDMHWQTKDKKRVAVSLNTTLLRNTRGEPVAMLNIARDISERKRLSEELEARTRQIETLYQETLSKSIEIERRNKELDDFAHVVSHDLKEPLVTIEGYGKILKNDFPQLGSTGLEYLNSVITAASRMKKSIDDLLALTRLGRITESFQPASIGELLKEIQSDLEFTLRERNVHVEIQKDMPVIPCNPSQMKLVFQNLISNAIKFNDKAVPEISVGFTENPVEYTFFVRDNGIGIETQYFDKIFGIFQQLHGSEEYGGTGVGLTIVKKIVDLHQGRVWLESKTGEGTTFFFSIPKDFSLSQSE